MHCKKRSMPPSPKFQERFVVVVWCFECLPFCLSLRSEGRGRWVRETGGECDFLIRTQIAQFELYNGAAVSQVTGSLSNSLQKETTCMLKSSTNTQKKKREKKGSPGLELGTAKVQFPLNSLPAESVGWAAPGLRTARGCGGPSACWGSGLDHSLTFSFILKCSLLLKRVACNVK